MGAFTKAEIEEALQSIISIIARAEKAREKFVRGTPQYTLQENRIKALYAAASLLSRELGNSEALDGYGNEDLERSLLPLASLISKSEKARAKLAEGTWQHTMLTKNLKALHIALPVVKKALSDLSGEKE